MGVSLFQGYLVHLFTYATQRVLECVRQCDFSIQNLMRHLKLVEDESQQMAYDDQKLSLTQFRAELERCVI